MKKEKLYTEVSGNLYRGGDTSHSKPYPKNKKNFKILNS